MKYKQPPWPAVPLHALINVDQLTGVAQTTTSFAPSASILLKTNTAAARPSPVLTALTVGVDQGELRHAEAEASWIAQSLHGDALLGAAATVAQVRRALPAYRVLHFSCHGSFRQRQPMESALQLADGELTAAELLRSGKLAADMVVLSACDTGLNQLRPGDEPLGLTRALLGCGARSLVVTLWPVHEIPTRLLMEQFYATWRQGLAKAAALTAAQRYLATLTLPTLYDRLVDFGLDAALVEATLQQFQTMWPGPHPFNHPYYWGAFLLVGDPG